MAICSFCCYDLLIISLTLLVGIISFVKWRHSYWSRFGLPYLPPSLFFGNIKDIFLGRKSFGSQFLQIYSALKGRGLRHGGVFMALSPVYVPIDPEIVKLVMQTDFAHFSSHGGYVNEKTDPLSVHLFNLDDVKWKNLRVKLTPTFTSGKMKMMFHTVVEIGRNLKELMDVSVDNGEPVDARDVLSRFGTDIISSVAFGLECNSLKDPNVSFRTYGKRAVEMELVDLLKIFAMVIIPHCILDVVGYKLTKSDVEKFFMEVIEDTVKYRERNNLYRRDFMHMLIQLKNLGRVTDDGRILDETGESKEVGLNIRELAAQAYIFFMAGYETSSTTVSFALYELAVNPEIQEKVRQEINRILEKHDGQMTYEAVMEMTYMDRVLQETLRKYPPLPILTRLCTKDYTIPGTDINLKKGVSVIIPVLGLHNDPEYYPDPTIFDPDRFLEEEKSSRPGFTFLPFGDGPRICIGMRFGLMQSKIALITFVKNYQVKLNKKTQTPLKFDKKSFVSRVKGGVWLDLLKLE